MFSLRSLTHNQISKDSVCSLRCDVRLSLSLGRRVFAEQQPHPQEQRQCSSPWLVFSLHSLNCHQIGENSARSLRFYMRLSLSLSVRMRVRSLRFDSCFLYVRLPTIRSASTASGLFDLMCVDHFLLAGAHSRGYTRATNIRAR